MGLALANAGKPLTDQELVRAFGKSRTTIQSWRSQGMPNDTLESANCWVLERKIPRIIEANKPAGDKSAWGKSDWEIEKLRLACEKHAHEIAEAKGLVHDKEKCSASLLEIRAIESRTLHGLGAKIASQFPEVPGLKAAIDKEVDEVLKRLKQ